MIILLNLHLQRSVEKNQNDAKELRVTVTLQTCAPLYYLVIVMSITVVIKRSKLHSNVLLFDNEDILGCFFVNFFFFFF